MFSYPSHFTFSYQALVGGCGAYFVDMVALYRIYGVFSSQYSSTMSLLVVSMKEGNGLFLFLKVALPRFDFCLVI